MEIEQREEIGDGVAPPESSLYHEVKRYYEEHVDFTDDIYYDLLAAYTLLTHRIEGVKELPYLAFIGVSGSGKTRALETMEQLCYDPMPVVKITSSALYRILTERTVTFLCDEFESNQRTPDLIQVMNGGYRRGQKVLLNIPDREQGWKPREFDVFGPKAIASIEQPTGAFRSRCICIPMVKSSSTRYRLNLEAAVELRNRLAQYRETNTEPVSDTWELMENAGITDRRLMELYNTMLSLTPELYRGRLMEFIQYEQRQIHRAEETSPFAMVFRAVDSVLTDNEPSSRVSIKEIAEKLKDDPDWEGDVSNKQIGTWMTSLGYTDIYRESDGMGRIIDPRVHESNRERFQRE